MWVLLLALITEQDIYTQWRKCNALRSRFRPRGFIPFIKVTQRSEREKNQACYVSVAWVVSDIEMDSILLSFKELLHGCTSFITFQSLWFTGSPRWGNSARERVTRVGFHVCLVGMKKDIFRKMAEFESSSNICGVYFLKSRISFKNAKNSLDPMIRYKRASRIYDGTEVLRKNYIKSRKPCYNFIH